MYQDVKELFRTHKKAYCKDEGLLMVLTSMPGKGVTSEPVAIMIFFVVTISSLPSLLSTVTYKKSFSMTSRFTMKMSAGI